MLGDSAAELLLISSPPGHRIGDCLGGVQWNACPTVTASGGPSRTGIASVALPRPAPFGSSPFRCVRGLGPSGILLASHDRELLELVAVVLLLGG
jgi:hypothetical protein